MEKGKNIEGNLKDIQGETALHKAARNGHAECVSLLIATTCNVSTQNSNGQTASIVAEQAGYLEIAAFIRQSELLMSDQQIQNEFQAPRFNRKRTRDMCDGPFKRMRTDSMYTPLPPAIRRCFLNPINTSVIEHERLCKQESGYTNSILESMFSEFHGC